MIKDWLKTLPSLLQEYDPAHILNADETSLFPQCLPNKTAILKGNECQSVRVTVLLAANQNGNEKLRPIMIGRSAKPRVFSVKIIIIISLFL